MKSHLITFLILLAQFAHAQTWVEILEKSNFHKNHPGRHAREITPSSPALEYLEKRRQVLENILKGTPAPIPIEIPELPSWTNMMMAQFDINRLVKFYAEQQDWEKVFQVLNVTEKVRSRIVESDPTLVWFLIAINHGNTPFTLLESLSGIKNQSKKAEIFGKLQNHWAKLRPSRRDFLKTRKGESRYVIEMAKDYKSFLKSLILDLDAPPLFWKRDAHHNITSRELLKFPIDPAVTKKKFLRDLGEDFAWIEGGKPIEAHPRSIKKFKVKDLDFYRNHPNGLVELYEVNFDYSSVGIADLIDRQCKLALTREIAWRWLQAEIEGKRPNLKSEILALLTPGQKREILKYQIEISPEKRSITTPAKELFELDLDTTLKLPKISNN